MAAHQQQPMSLMAIDKTNFRPPVGPSRGRQRPRSQCDSKAKDKEGEEDDDTDDDLLTIRILEASERKMRMIKELLTPEEYQSLSTDLFQLPIGEKDFGGHSRPDLNRDRLSRQVQLETAQEDRNALSGPPFRLHGDENDSNERSRRTQRLRLSKSESCLARPRDNFNLHENLAKRRQAIEFFFATPDDELASRRVTNGGQSIELRFGYHLEPNLESEAKLLRSYGPVLSPMDGLGNLFALLVSMLIGILANFSHCLKLKGTPAPEDQAQPSDGKRDKLPEVITRASGARQDTGPNEPELGGELKRRHRVLGCSPYNRKANLDVMLGRLVADGANQLRKVLMLSAPVKTAAKLSRERPNPLEAHLFAHYRPGQIVLISANCVPPQSTLNALSGSRSGQLVGLPRIAEFTSIDTKRARVGEPHQRSALLVHHPFVERLIHKCLPLNRKPLIQTSQASNSTGLKLKIDKITIKKHKLISNEEKLARRVIEEFEALERLYRAMDEVNEKQREIVRDASPRAPELRVTSKMIKLIEIRISLSRAISSKQKKLLKLWSDVEAERRRQGFNSTNLRLTTNCSEVQDDQLGDILLSKLKDELTSLEANGGRTQQAGDYLRRLQDLAKSAANDGELLSKFRLSLDASTLESRPDHECPDEELVRRRTLNGWFHSLSLRLTATSLDGGDLGSQHHLDFSNLELTSDKWDLRFRSEEEHFWQLFVALDTTADKFRLRVQICGANLKEKGRGLFSLAKLALVEQAPLAESIVELPTRTASREPQLGAYQLDVTIPAEADGAESSELALDFSVDYSGLRSGVTNETCVDTKRHSSDRLRDRLHSILFSSKSGKQHVACLLDGQTRSARLLNRISLRTLARLSTAAHSSHPYCLLDPYLDDLSQPASVATGAPTGASMEMQLPGFGLTSARCALLAWRWSCNDQAQTIYLADRENQQKVQSLTSLLLPHLATDSSLSLEEFKARLISSKTVTQPTAIGFRWVELNRSLALDYIRQCEQLIEQSMACSSQLPTRTDDEEAAMINPSGGGVSVKSTADLLIESQIKWKRPNLPNVVPLVRALLPRPTAHRPLMPKRRLASDQLADDTKLGHLVEGLSKAGSFLGAGGKSLDSAVGDHWKKFARAGKHAPVNGPLRLVVTIQQATNVPYRSVPIAGLEPSGKQQHQPGYFGSPMARSSSPFYSLSPAFDGSAPSPIQLTIASPSLQQQQQRLALSSTTYIEAIFQRKQLATSLAQGRSPAWNETLFFLVDQADQKTLSFGEDRPQQVRPLVDESLQLNLYDCRCYVQSGGSYDAAFETLDFVADHDGSTMRGHQSPLLVAGQRQRIERHLIGSLRVPMSLLLTAGGRLEGSFAMSRPLLIESQYQSGEPYANGSSHINGTTNLRLFITLDPPVVSGGPQHDQCIGSVHLPLGSSERLDLFEYAQIWERVMLRLRRPPLPSTTTGAASKRRARPASATTSGDAELLPVAAWHRRHIRALVLRDNARYCLSFRLLAPRRPPGALARGSEESQMRRLARFVALLSPLKYGLFEARPLASSLWFDSSQLLERQLGGPEEKAVLLCSYFLWLGKCSALLLGDSMPAGRCVYVLVWADQLNSDTSQLELQMSELMDTLAASSSTAGNDNEEETKRARNNNTRRPVDCSNFIARLPILINSRTCHLWDPTTGTRYDLGARSNLLNRQRAPLMSVGSVVTCENVYANVAHASSPETLVFDVRQRSLWFPLFTSYDQPPASVARSEGELVQSNLVVIRRLQRRIFQTRATHRQLSSLDHLGKMLGRPQIIGQPPSQPDLASDERCFSAAECQELKEALERSIKSHLLTWRPTRPTYFNRTLSRAIGDKLASFEDRILGREQSLSQVVESADYDVDERRMSHDPNWWRSDLAELISSEAATMSVGGGPDLAANRRQVISWPVNLAYTSTRAILDGLYASGVHNADLVLLDDEQHSSTTAGEGENQRWPASNLSTQFLVACHVEPYPARLMSVWLYVGALVISSGGSALASNGRSSGSVTLI